MKLGRLAKTLILVAWLVFMTRLLTMTVPSGLSLGTSFDDKLIHIGLFGILAYLLIETVESYYVLKYRYVIILSFLLAVIYAQLMEDVQGYLTYRSRDLVDTLAGTLGAALAAMAVYFHDYYRVKKPKLLLHMCCIGCGVAVIKKLRKEYDVVLYFYNPNISPRSELSKRLSEIKRIAKSFHLQVIVSHALHRTWLQKIRGHEHEPERGGRCVICYRDRLTSTARRAKRLGFDAFTSTLSISPHKNYDVIKRLGEELQSELGVKFLDEDFKKDGGFQRSCKLSKELNLYRQTYCGCEFSKR